MLNRSVGIFGDLLAFSSADGTVEICSLASGRTLHTLKGDANAILALAFSADGKLLAASNSGAVRLWDVQRDFAEKEVLTFPPGGWWSLPTFLAFDPKARFLASGSVGPTRIWDLQHQPPRPMAQFFQGHTCLRFAPTGSFLLAGRESGTVELWTIAAIEEARTEAQGKSKLPPSTFPLIHSTPTTVVKGGHALAVWGSAASPDGHWLATASHDQTVKLWDAATRKLVRTLDGYSDIVWPVAFSPDSRYLATGSEEPGTGSIKIWEVTTGREHRHFRGHKRQVFGLAYHPKKPWLASAAADGSVLLWDLESGKSLRLHQFDRAVYSVDFSPDGLWLAASCMDHRVALWNLTEFPENPTAPTRLLEGHTDSVYVVGFSADGRYLASGAEQGTIILWDATTFARLTTLKAGTGQIRGVSFSRDGQLLAGGAYVNRTVVWDLSLVRRTLADLNLDW
jgi:WD40 repeat protein